MTDEEELQNLIIDNINNIKLDINKSIYIIYYNGKNIWYYGGQQMGESILKTDEIVFTPYFPYKSKSITLQYNVDLDVLYDEIKGIITEYIFRLKQDFEEGGKHIFHITLNKIFDPKISYYTYEVKGCLIARVIKQINSSIDDITISYCFGKRGGETEREGNVLESELLFKIYTYYKQNEEAFKELIND